jgi:hypothetical protein
LENVLVLKIFLTFKRNKSWLLTNHAALVAPKKVIILDRGEDLAAPLVHELTYQCAVYDMLQARLDGDTIKHECVSMLATIYYLSLDILGQPRHVFCGVQPILHLGLTRCCLPLVTHGQPEPHGLLWVRLVPLLSAVGHPWSIRNIGLNMGQA